MRKNRVVEQNRCYHLVSRLAHRAFFLDDEEKDRAVALMRRVEAGVQAGMSYYINNTISIDSFSYFSWGTPVVGNTGIKAKHGRSTSTVAGSGTGGSR